MQDYEGFCRQRLRACFLRRKTHPAGSEGWAHCVKEARSFLRAYRVETGRLGRRRTTLKDHPTVADILLPQLDPERNRDGSTGP